ncbi:MAG: MFS transporter [Chromatiales bacterium]|nr:MFS transporter [Chromatiales bacterium]
MTPPESGKGGQFRLLRMRRFGPFFLTQFLGAFNDNVFKNALIIYIAFGSTELTVAQQNTLTNLSAGLFILPFLIFSFLCGQLADKYEKSALIRRIKLLEVVIMLAAAAAFLSRDLPVLIGLLFLMGAQSSLFGPVKYSILPQHLESRELVGGNALVQSGTYLAILFGTLTGGLLIAIPESGPAWVAFAVVALALAGWLSSLAVPAANAVDSDLALRWNPWRETVRIVGMSREEPTVFLSMLGISWFWYLGASYLTQLPNYTRLTLGGDEHVVTLLLTLFSVGIGVGSLLCERLSRKRLEPGLVPFGLLGVTLFGLDLALVRPQVGESLIGGLTFAGSAAGWRVMLDVLLLGAFGGLYIVPLYTLIQLRSAVSRRSRIIAANNVLNALFMVVSALVAMMMLGSGAGIPDLFLLVAGANLTFGLWLCAKVPEFPRRALGWLSSAFR